MTITLEDVRNIIDKETVAESGIVLQTTTAARRVLDLVERENEALRAQVAELASLDPKLTISGDVHCFFCMAYDVDEHEKGCLWARAKAFAKLGEG